jgi:ornithine carbamoyltransferase
MFDPSPPPRGLCGTQLDDSISGECQWKCRSKIGETRSAGGRLRHQRAADGNRSEVTDPVISGPRSAVYDPAENRLHGQKAVMALTMS